MKNASGIVSIILLISVGILFFLVLDKDKSKGEEPKVVTLPPSNSEGLSIAYVDMDSLQVYYNYYKELMEEFQAEAKRAEEALLKKQSVFQENVKLFEEKASTMSQQEFEYYRNDLEQTRNKMIMDQQEVERGLMAKEQELMLLMKEEVDSVLGMIKNENHLDFVFTYPLGSGLLYADQSHDITPLVLDKLNGLRPSNDEE
ncbi:MAG: OmpH family outer membrane protein [Schleiferiaceae bacterium]|jgi:outer membrane protein|nr:OmpH family outer membrane protein [Schleiferiaceae bacterium]